MIFVFVGPTLPTAEARRLLDATFMPPVSQGDIYRIGLHRPRAIGIIDGYFNHVPSVWHKEILWAMDRGIRVYGGASMGALRAAELAPFGMAGIGWIFEAFRSGTLEDDDEVAICHGPPEDGYRQMSEAMVNIRQTLTAAECAGVISMPTLTMLLSSAKDLYYPERDYRAIVPMARAQGAPGDELDAFAEWLLYGRVDQKRLDAVAMLRTIADEIIVEASPPIVSYHFEHTALWDELQRSAGQFTVQAKTEWEMLPQQALLDELRLNITDWPQTVQVAVARGLAAREMRRQGLALSEDRLYEAIVRFRLERGLTDRDDLERWMQSNDLSQVEFLRLLEKEANIREVEELAGPDIASELVDYARVAGLYPDLARRAIEKRSLFEQIDANPPDPEVYDCALEWFFNKKEYPCLSLEEQAKYLGFESVDDLRRALIGEYLYCRRNTYHGHDQTTNRE